jgi:predicted CXXCH cytochrome family protein
MRRYYRVPKPILIALVLAFSLSSIAAKKAPYGIASFAKYVEIPGASPVGMEACTACHTDITKDFRHAFHAQQGVECEQCHGPGSLHVAGGGDVSKVISFSRRSAADANGVCLSCHIRDAKIRNWLTGAHSSNRIRCADCHRTHNDGTNADSKAGSQAQALVDVMSPGRATTVESLVPETKVVIQPRWEANDACLKCHETQRGQMSLPYHHPLREGKMSCADCHDPHGGPSGKNLRTANTNQLCLSCHSQYRGPFAYQHPPVTENCMLCHSPHGSANTNLLSVSEPALCLQCHAGHHNGAGTPLPDRCTNCHGSIHGTDTPTPSGGSRFVDKGPSEPELRASGKSGALTTRAHLQTTSTASLRLLPSHASTFGIGAASGALAILSRLTPMSGGSMGEGGQNPGETQLENTYGEYSVIPGSYRLIDQTGFGGRVGEYDTLHQSAGADAATSYVSTANHLTVVSRGNVLSGDDYQAASQVTMGEWIRFGFDVRSFVQQQDHYSFYAFPVLDVSSDCGGPCDTTTDLIPSHVPFAVTRRLGKAYGQVKLPKLPVHLFVNGDWQARAGVNQFAYLDENVTTSCGEQCHYQSQFQRVNYTTRNIGGGADVDLGSVRLTWKHKYSSFNDRLIFPTGTFGQFTPADEPPPPPIPVPPAVSGGNYPIDIPSPNEASSDRLSLNWTASPKLTFNGNVTYTRLRDTFTSYPQNAFDTDETVTWLPLNRLRVTADYHQQNLLNNFTPVYNLFGNVSYHDHWEGVRAEYELPHDFDIEAHYKRTGITRSNSALWPQGYSFDNTDLLTVVPSSFSNTAGMALRYHDRGLWSARAGYEWTGTHEPGYLVVPKSNNRIFANVTLTPATWLTFANDTSILVQNDFVAIPLLRSDGTGLPGDFQRRNRFYFNTASATLRIVPDWNLGLGYSYQQNNLTSYMAFQNDSAAEYVFNQPAVPYKQISQTYWGESSYSFKQRLGLNLRLTYNSARSGFRPDLNPNDAALLGNQSLIAGGNCDLGAPPPCFSPSMFAASQANMAFSSTQISEVIVPQWIGESKAYYLFPHKFEGGLIFYYGSYRDYWNPGLNGVLRTFNLYVGRTW